ncbi:DUF5067 domain-containing protein [Rummeliibacillus stabekisii]|uniref:DUF5067 domain-containing protein n=1 Tax=Rummeliibacillus stabekisii TaxID=241244 RepID=A0A143HCV4_9BACL|nr:DUF5067 domain-containing protein [Rummeliibacillus stabekisii]AMW99290.1 hypothetical protein ATY39_07320 [Rummeliibacillus stabekisii]
MKKILTSIILLSALIVAGCGNNTGSETKEQNKSAAEKTTVDAPKPTSTFKNGVLETNNYTLKITKSEIIKSPMENKPGLFITYELTNNTDDTNVVPNDTLLNLVPSQENDTSKVELEGNYYFLDAFGDEDDTETYNKMVDLDNASANELLPGKTVKFVEAYGLDNDTHPVVFTGVDADTLSEIGTYKVELKK